MATVSFGGRDRTGGLWVGRSRWWKAALVGVALAAVGAAAWRLTPREDAAATGAVADAIKHADGAGASTTGPAVLGRCRQTLMAAEDKLDSIPAMTAVFQKQERIDGTLQPVNVMDLKVRHRPLSVYMKWRQPEEGQEIIWSEAANDGKILVCLAGWKRKLMRTVKIDPEGDQAMAVSRRPITNIGIWNFTSRLRQTLEQEVMREPSIEATVTTGDEISGRPCDRYTFEYPGAGKPDGFHKMVLHLDNVLGVPVALEHYRWFEEKEGLVSRLEESYLFRDLNLDVELADADFNENNPAYEFVEK